MTHAKCNDWIKVTKDRARTEVVISAMLYTPRVGLTERWRPSWCRSVQPVAVDCLTTDCCSSPARCYHPPSLPPPYQPHMYCSEHELCHTLHLCAQNIHRPYTCHTTTVLQPFFWDHPGEPVPEENFWTLWCKGRLTEADTPTIRLGATPSGLTSAHLHHPPRRHDKT